MKKLLISVTLLVALVAAGCSQSDTEENQESNNQETEEKSTGSEAKPDENTIKSDLLKTQLNLANKLRPHHSKVVAYHNMKANEEEPPAPEDLQAAAEEAKTEAGEAVTTLEGFEMNSELSDDVKEQYSSALDSLKKYYKEVQKTLEASPEKADLAGAQEHFDQFQQTLDKIYEEAGLIPTDMSAELS
ncbi:hypothetical protein ACGTN9_09405 [Halobacillus sp. MO56]